MGLTPGTRCGDFEVGALLGAGGMGEVYSAHDTRLGREVALKVLSARMADHPDRLARFEREARVLASLNHPNIATLHGIETSDGQPVLVMELVRGDTLDDRLRRGPLPLRDALRTFVQVAGALEAAHAAGVVHRDLKPANLKITPEGRVKVLDFGLARPYGLDQGAGFAETRTAPAPPITQGVVVGTAAYMSPEQARGLPVDKRTDVWAFGATLYESLTGRRAFDGKTATDTLAFVLEREPDWSALPADTPPAVRRLLERCLRKEAEERLHDIADARIELDDVLRDARSNSGAMAPTGHPAPVPARGWAQRLAWAGLGLALGAGIAAGGLLVFGRPAEPPRQTMRFQSPLPAGWFFRAVGGSGSPLSISRDGRDVVFVAREGEKGNTKVQLFHRHMGELGADPIPGTEGARGPFISRNGQLVGFAVQREVKVTPVERNSIPARTLASTKAIPVAGVDVAFFGGDFSRNGDPVYIGECTRGLRAAYYSGGRHDKVKISDVLKNPTWTGQHQFPQELPDGKHLLFTWWNPPESEVRVLTLETGETKTLVTNASNGRYVPTGHIVYGWDGALYAIAFDVRRLETEGEPVKVVDGVRTELSRGAVHFAVSDEGTLLYVPGGVVQNAGFPVWVGRDGGTERILDGSPINGPWLSPDGSRILFVRGMGEVWTYELARGVWRRLTDERGTAVWATWMPDGRRVVFQYAEIRDGVPGTGQWFNLYWRAADGSGPMERLTTSDTLQQPGSISPDGRVLAFTQQAKEDVAAGTSEIWMLPLDGDRTPHRWLAASHSEVQPAFSPDGAWVAYASSESGQWQVMVRPFSRTSPVEQVSIEGGWEPIWSRDGREIYFRTIDGKKVLAASFEAGSTLQVGRPRVVVEGNFLGGIPFGRRWDLSTDGQRFLMWTGTDPMTAPPVPYYNVVLNWFGELTQKFAARH
jgi:hypothetical protein